MLNEVEKRFIESYPVEELVEIVADYYLREYRRISKGGNCYRSRKNVEQLIETIKNTEVADDFNIKLKKRITKELIDIYEYMCITAVI